MQVAIRFYSTAGEMGNSLEVPHWKWQSALKQEDPEHQTGTPGAQRKMEGPALCLLARQSDSRH